MKKIDATQARKSNGKSVGDFIGNWELLEFLGQGGNGDVWKARCHDGRPHALKILYKLDSEARKRFYIEIETLKKVDCISGVVPLIDNYNPEPTSQDIPWFVMPLGEKFEIYRDRTRFVDLIKNFVALAQTLCELHEQGYSHRDIKPANILYLNERLCLSDFGLVKYPNRPDITPARRDVGAKFTMAPEMRRQASTSNGQFADVYSFAKSLWIAISNIPLGFDGQYVPDSTLQLKPYIEGWYPTPLDQLMAECTATEPRQRPTMLAVRDRLKEWITISEDFEARNELEWIELGSKLFPLGVPARASWLDIDEICSVLNAVAGAPGLNHMFYPNGGGMTIKGATRAFHKGMIELQVAPKAIDLVKPKKLSFESFGKAWEWSYFRLEAEEISPTGIKGALHTDGISEELVEIELGEYVHPSCWDYGEFNGHPLPESARRIQRFLKGSFVFFSTTSFYNKISATYDARHNSMTEEDFREYIAKGALATRELKKKKSPSSF